MSIALLAAVSACGSDTGSGPNGASQVTVLLTDAPGDVQEAVVTIDQIYLQGGPGGRTVLRDAPATVKLTDLAGETVELLKEVELPAGSYNELRFVISGGYVKVEEQGAGSRIYASSPTYAGLPAGAQATGSLQMPSLGGSGLKVDFTEQLVFTGGEKILLVDFDISQSFGRAAGNSGNWVMHPVIKGASLAASGGLRVVLEKDPALTLPASAPLTAFKADLDGGAIPFVDNGGTVDAAFRYVLPGDHVLTIKPPAGFTSTTDPATPKTVTVATGSTLVQTLTLKTVVPAP